MQQRFFWRFRQPTLCRLASWVSLTSIVRKSRAVGMTLRFTVLASGSSGNASLIQTPVSGILLDAGLGPQELTQRLERSGHAIDRVGAMLLTHTHTDHWKDRTLAWMRRRGLPLYCHPGHHAIL